MNRDMDPPFNLKWIATAISVCFRDWWRGWSDADLARVKEKIAMFGDQQTLFMLMSDRELLAFKAYEREQHKGALK